MKNITQSFLSILLLTAVVSFSSCGATKMKKMLAGHQLALKEASINPNMKPEAKFDLLAETFVTVLDEAVSFSGVRKPVQHLNRFTQQNEKNINSILGGLTDWKDNMSPLDQIAFWGNIMTKPYAKKLVTLIPKFEKKVNRKIKTFTFASKLVKFLVPKRLLGSLDLN